MNDTIILEGTITYAGRTSMEVRVCTYCEALSGARERINEAYLVLVAIDDNERPIPVPPVLPETDEEKAAYEAAIRRRELRRSR